MNNLQGEKEVDARGIGKLWGAASPAFVFQYGRGVEFPPHAINVTLQA